MSTNNFFRSDLNSIYNIVQNGMILYPVELCIWQAKSFFSRDIYYSYKTDNYGYPITPDHTDLPKEAGIQDDTTTRIFIGSPYRKDIVFFPSILFRNAGSTSVPFSINREAGTTIYQDVVFQDGYGNIKFFKTPKYFVFAGAWEGSINIDIRAKDPRARDDLVDLTSLLFTDIAFNDLAKAGLVIKGVSAGSPSEVDDYNDKLFTQTITLQTRSEWRRQIPVSNVIEIIKTSIEFGDASDLTKPPALNLTINTNQTLTDMILSL